MTQEEKKEIEAFKLAENLNLLFTAHDEARSEALAKAVPLKPYVNRIHDATWNTDLMVYQCGRCKRRLRVKATRDKYCPSCGQRVRWE